MIRGQHAMTRRIGIHKAQHRSLVVASSLSPNRLRLVSEVLATQSPIPYSFNFVILLIIHKYADVSTVKSKSNESRHNQWPLSPNAKMVVVAFE